MNTDMKTLASITDLRFHDLRHTAATRMIEGGMEVAEVAPILGPHFGLDNVSLREPAPRHRRKGDRGLSRLNSQPDETAIN